MHSKHTPACVFALTICSSQKRLTQIIRHFSWVGRVDPLLRLRCGLALPLCWGANRCFDWSFFSNLFAWTTDPRAMLNERVYQLKPVVRSTRGLIFSLRNESSPRTQVSRQLETAEPQREITGTHRVVVGFFLVLHIVHSVLRHMMIGAVFSKGSGGGDKGHSHGALI